MQAEVMLKKTIDYLSGHLPGFAELIVKIVLCALIYVIGKKLIAKLVRVVRAMLDKSHVSPGAATFVVSMLKIILYLTLILGIAMQFGLKESSVAALVASGGVAIGLALQGGLSNLAGGFLILLFQPFQIGDYILTQGQEGTVQKIEILYTTLHTIDNRKVIVPNGNLANNVIVNVTAADRRKLEITVGISYEDSIQTAKAVLQRLLTEHPLVLHDQEAQVFVAELGESSVVLGVRCWVKTDQYFPVLWQLNEQIKEAFDEAGIHIPYPQMDVHMKQE
ncbi:MAG: mechanosensitive ion channel family protein [Lachnospiraceae bacterium]|nr:mechanosensitive ion channel family protein [Lachnospiraceae bacterium]